jgi:hypothetical protein
MSGFGVSVVDYKAVNFTDVPDATSMLVGENPFSVLAECQEFSDLATALEAVDGLATEGESFFDPIKYIIEQIPIDLHRTLSHVFVLLEFEEIPLLEIVYSPLFAIIRDTFIQYDDISLLLGCANLVEAVPA